MIHKVRNVKGRKGYMAIKLDLEKAYDHLSLNFVIDSLKDVDLDSHFVNLIWYFISFVSTNILWNGECIGKFSPSRAIK